MSEAGKLPLIIRKKIRDDEDPAKQKAIETIEQAFGISGVVINIDYPTIYSQLTNEGKEYFPNIAVNYLSPITHAIQRWANDDLTKEAFLSAWKTKEIRFRINPTTPSYCGIAFENGVLFIETKPNTFCTNVSDVALSLPRGIDGETSTQTTTNVSTSTTTTTRQQHQQNSVVPIKSTIERHTEVTEQQKVAPQPSEGTHVPLLVRKAIRDCEEKRRQEILNFQELLGITGVDIKIDYVGAFHLLPEDKKGQISEIIQLYIRPFTSVIQHWMNRDERMKEQLLEKWTTKELQFRMKEHSNFVYCGTILENGALVIECNPDRFGDVRDFGRDYPIGLGIEVPPPTAQEIAAKEQAIAQERQIREAHAAAERAKPKRCDQHFARDRAYLCSSCGFGNSASHCVICNRPFAKLPAMVCSRCRTNNCVKCNRSFAKIPAMLCSSCGFGSSASHCCKLKSNT